MDQQKFLSKCRTAGMAVRLTPIEARVHVVGQTDEYSVVTVAEVVRLRFKRGGKMRSIDVPDVPTAQSLIAEMIRRPLS